MRNFIKSLARDERGVTALEYGILAAIVVGILVGVGSTFDTSLTALWAAVTGGLDDAASAATGG